MEEKISKNVPEPKADPEEKKRPRRSASSRLREENEALREEANRLREELEETRDRMMRSAAELENFKKRSAREKEEWFKYAHENLIKEILPIVDNLERALDHAQNHPDRERSQEALLEGIQMIHRQFLSILERFGVKPIEALDQPFDPSLHEAMMQMDSEEHEPNTVVQELERGYILHDRLLRPTKVAVSRRIGS